MFHYKIRWTRKDGENMISTSVKGFSTEGECRSNLINSLIRNINELKNKGMTNMETAHVVFTG